MEPEEFSRVIGQILGSAPVSTEDRDRILDAMGTGNSIEQMPEDIQQLLFKLQETGQSKGSRESRAARLSTLNRYIIKDSDKCVLCVANNDPRKVPVHPNCHCDVVTNEVETGVVDGSSRLLDVLRTTDEFIELETITGAELPEAIQINPETVAVFDPNDVRFADLARWLEQVQPYLEATNQYISIVVDDDTDEALVQIEETIEAIAEDPEVLVEAIRNKKLWFGIAQAVI